MLCMVEPIKPTYPSFQAVLQAEAVRRGDPTEKKYQDQIALSTRVPSNFSYDREGNHFEVRFARNSPLNGQSYLDAQGHPQTIEGASSSSGDRTNEHVLSMRGIYRNGRLVCATGRPDTLLRGQEQSEFVPHGTTYVVQSLMSPLGFFGLGAFNEKQSTLDEAKVLEKLPHKPFLFVRPTNLFSLLENSLPKWLSGRGKAETITENNHTQFKQYFYSLGILFSPDEKKCIDDCFYFLEQGNLLPEEEVLLRDLLSKFAGLPIIYHCKSSTDRTTVATNISCILAGWSTPFPRVNGRYAPHLIIRDPRFKEEFAAHTKENLRVTLLSRGVEGFSWGKGLLTNPTAVRLLPHSMTRPTKILPRVILAFVGYFLSTPFNLLALPFSRDKWGVIKKIINPLSAWNSLPDREIHPDAKLLKL